jgi:tetratricopeptide (TPR) repeat protein
MPDPNESLKIFDIDSAIAAATLEIAKNPSQTTTGQAPAAGQTPQNSSLYEMYRDRGIARCFNPPKKDEPCTDAISDLSAALLYPNPVTTPNPPPPPPLNPKDRILYYRAYAYYRSKIYDRAIADCETILNPNKKEDEDKTLNKEVQQPFYELLGLIYSALNRWPDAAENYRKAIKIRLGQNEIVSPSLLDNYHNAYRKIQED